MDNKELMELIEELCKAAELVKSEVAKIVKKGDLTPAELESLYKATCLAEKLNKCCNGEEMNSMGYGYGYGYGGQSQMMPQGNGYGGYGGYGEQYGGPGMGSMVGYSEARGRSPVTGRYISRGMNSGYSGHSIEDRMVASLEQQMDSAKSDYEREIIRKEIERIRMGNNR